MVQYCVRVRTAGRWLYVRAAGVRRVVSAARVWQIRRRLEKRQWERFPWLLLLFCLDINYSSII